MKTVFRFMAASALVLAAASCATMVPISSVKPPTIDTSTVRRLAVRPFAPSSGIASSGVSGSDVAQLAQYLTERATAIITGTGKFELVAPNDPNADGIFTGEIRIFSSADSRQEGQDRDGNPWVEYGRKVNLEFSYSILSTRTNMPIGGQVVVKTNNTSDSNRQERGRLASAQTLARHLADSGLGSLASDIVPVIVRRNIALAKETSKDKALKNRMKEVAALAKSGAYQQALEAYTRIHEETGSEAARRNAEILSEVISSAAAARGQMEQLEQARAGLTDRAVQQAVAALTEKVPARSNISLMTENSTDRNLLDEVMGKMTGAIVQAGTISLVDRSNQALIAAEQRFQVSGAVDDNSMVSLGRQLGVRYMSFIRIGGVASGRKLYLRILDIETSRVIYQGDFEI